MGHHREGMKICFLLDEICAGSSSVIAGEMVKGMRKRGYEIEIVAIVRREIDDKMKENLGDAKIKYAEDYAPKIIRQIDFKFPFCSFFSGHHLLYMPWARKIFRDYDLIISSCHYTTFLSRLSGKSYLLMLWRKAEETARLEYHPALAIIGRLLDWWAISGCRAILISNHWYKFKKPVYYLYPGCHPLKTIKPLTERRKIVFSYDRWDKANDPRRIINLDFRAFPKDWELWLGGYWHDKELTEKFLIRANELGFLDRIILLGGLDQKTIYSILSVAGWHIHLPKEPFGMQVLEAMACGCPSTYQPDSGVAELFKSRDMVDDNYMNYLWQQAKKHTWEHYCDTLEEAICS